MIRECANIEEIKPLIQRWHKETNGKDFDLDICLEDAYADFQALINRKDCNLFVLVKDRPVGFIGVVSFKSPIGRYKMANEHYFYVLPENRGIGSIRLIKAVFDWAKEQRCSHVLMNASMLASNLHDQVCEIYECMGMKKFETTHILKIGG